MPAKTHMPFLLRADEAVLLVLLVGMGADQLVAGLGRRPWPERLPSPSASAQQFWLADSRRSPLATSSTCFFLAFGRFDNTGMQYLAMSGCPPQ